MFNIKLLKNLIAIHPELSKLYEEILIFYQEKIFRNLSPPFKTIMEDIEKQAIFKSLEIYLELGNYSFSLFMEKIKNNIENIETSKMSR